MCADKFICVQINLFLCRRGTLLCQRGTLLVGGSYPVDPLPPQHIPLPSLCGSQGRCLPPLLRIPWRHSIFSRPVIDFGEGFLFNEPFNFDDSGDGISMIATGGSPSYGAYDDDSCSFSVESSVQLRRRCRRHKRRSPNRLYRKGSVKLLVRVCPWRLTVPLRQRGGQRPSGLHATASTRLPRRLVWASSW